MRTRTRANLTALALLLLSASCADLLSGPPAPDPEPQNCRELETTYPGSLIESLNVCIWVER